jgi:hypothetical protein
LDLAPAREMDGTGLWRMSSPQGLSTRREPT